MKVFIVLIIIVAVAILCTLLLYFLYNKINSRDFIASDISNELANKDGDANFKNLFMGEKRIKPRVLQISGDYSVQKKNTDRNTLQEMVFSNDQNSKIEIANRRKGAQTKQQMDEELSKYVEVGITWLNRGIEEFKNRKMSNKGETKNINSNVEKENNERNDDDKNWNNGIIKGDIEGPTGMEENSVNENVVSKENILESNEDENNDLIEQDIMVEDLDDKISENQREFDEYEEY